MRRGGATRLRLLKTSGLILLSLAVLGLVAFRLWGPPGLVWSDEVAQAKALAAQVESFRRRYGRLPQQDELTFPSDRILYDPQPDGGYRVGFAIGFDENPEMDPASGRWDWDR